jgi:hypothetical protein
MTLLDEVIEAHGGLDRWRQTTSLSARLVLGGPFWPGRGWPDGFDLTVTLATQREHISITYADGREAVFDVAPERLTLRTSDGAPIEARHDPRATFPLPFDRATTRWDALQVAYFHATANWNYLTEPWQFADPETTTRRLPDWAEPDGATWHRLAVTFAPGNANHNPEQVFYFDAHDLLLRRMDYRPDVTGNAAIAHYCHDPMTVAGLTFPTRRHVHPRNDDNNANRDVSLIDIDVSEIMVT